MPPRSTPTARQERLGTELRKMREAAAMTARDAARLLGVDPAKVSHIESGRVGVSEERVRRLAAFYSCDDTALVDALSAMTYEQRGEGWWEAYRGVLPASMLDLAEMEHHATYLHTIQITHVPGLFQTQDYARTVFSFTFPRLPQAEMEARLGFRMERQKILLRDEPQPFEAVIHEAALRMRFGGRKVARAQLEHLRELCERPNLTLRVIPFRVEEPIGSGHAMYYTGGPVPQLDTVQIDTAPGVSFLHAEPHLRKYRTLFEAVKAASLSCDASRDLLDSIVREL
ncbi:helix-turn-helix domain-containing protein [Streptomyces sparsogenes]|uniref:DNA-binding protein n=1 Tax=Streptomyces sparsogenes DSM 40356 TaxID=1331668 RepID=A0A1R1S4X2_9ACTN|nr:helix-turn-helix transcriptional regulator [Streptomyces sparsogenes]OMI33314.1 DNA-binding protein [Streptomyces sparsogenes DSM 40356]